MPARPGSHLDLFLVRVAPIDAPEELLEALRRDDLTGGPGSERAVEVGYAGLRLDRPAAPAFYANRQGGFGVRCPACAESLVQTFGRAMSAWRTGGPRHISCPACAVISDLGSLHFAPHAAFGGGAVVLVDVGSMRLTPWGVERFESILGAFELVGSRR